MCIYIYTYIHIYIYIYVYISGYPLHNSCITVSEVVGSSTLHCYITQICGCQYTVGIIYRMKLSKLSQINIINCTYEHCTVFYIQSKQRPV